MHHRNTHLSHLLHPPLLDETGLASATRWYVEGFAQRSGIEARLDLPEESFRLPALVELSLFRIVQESLTNVHRHSGSTTVEVKVTIGDGQAGLVVRDSGHGIPSEKLERFLQDGANSGVGLGGMRERVNDLGGTFDVQSNAQGTAIIVMVPLSARAAGDSEIVQDNLRKSSAA